MTRQPEKYYRGADVVITDGLGFTNCELAYNRIPAVAFVSEGVAGRYPRSFSLRIEILARLGAVRVVADQEGPQVLWQVIQGAGRSLQTSGSAVEQLLWARPPDVAKHLLRHLPGASEHVA